MSSRDPSEDLHDAALAEDIALLGDMMAAAASDAGRVLTEAEVDHALGLPDPDAAAAASQRRPARRSGQGRRPHGAGHR